MSSRVLMRGREKRDVLESNSVRAASVSRAGPTPEDSAFLPTQRHPHVESSVLFVDAVGASPLDLRRALADGHPLTGSPWSCDEVAGLRAARTEFSPKHHAVTLMDVGRYGDQALDAVRSWQEWFHARPTVVLTDGWSASEQVEVISLGLSDVLDRRDVGGGALSRSLWLAVERDNADRIVSQSVGNWADAQDEAATVTSRLYGQPPLRERNPEAFRQLSERYADLLKRAIRARFLKTDDDRTQDVAALSKRLGQEMATAQDAFSVHQQGLRVMKRGSGRRRRALIDESRYVLLAVTARLVSYYRSRAIYEPSRERDSFPAQKDVLCVSPSAPEQGDPH